MAKFVYLLCAAFIAAICQKASSLSIQPHSIGIEEPANELVLGVHSPDSFSIFGVLGDLVLMLECSVVGLFRSITKAMETAIFKLNHSVVDYYDRILSALSECSTEMGFFICIKQSIVEMVTASGKLIEDLVESVYDFPLDAIKGIADESSNCIDEYKRL